MQYRDMAERSSTTRFHPNTLALAIMTLLALSISSAVAHDSVLPETGNERSGPSHQDIDEIPTVDEEAALVKRAKAEQIGVNPSLQSVAGAASLQVEVEPAVVDPSVVGQWGAVQEWPVIGVFASLLDDGRVLVFDSVGDGPTESTSVQNFTRAMVWNPDDGYIKRIDVDTGYNIFCSGFASLPDGRVFIAGGNADAALNGLRETHTFDPLTDGWSLGQRMNYDRWYPAVTPLANGEMLVTGGGPSVPEVRQLDGTIRQLDNAAESYWANREYPWLQAAPNGRTTFLGPANQLGLIDTEGEGAWQGTSSRDYSNRSYGSYAVFDIGRAVIAGGGFESNDHSQTSAVIVDLNSASKEWTGFMNFRRHQHNLTVLADGTVLATGGFSSNASLVDLDNTVYAAELWTSQTGDWEILAEEARARNYHSIAMLLPDGRVLSAGGGICGVCQDVGYIQKNAQVFTPPYLFRDDGSGQLATRPEIQNAPERVGYDEAFTIDSTQLNDISKIAMVRTGSVTHSQNMEQRYIPLQFDSANGVLNLQSPGNASIAPPGTYMLFVIDSSGVPSVAEIVRVGAGA